MAFLVDLLRSWLKSLLGSSFKQTEETSSRSIRVTITVDE